MQARSRWTALGVLLATAAAAAVVGVVVATQGGDTGTDTTPTAPPNPPIEETSQPTYTLDDAEFPTLPVGSPLPSGEECAERVRAAGLEREVRPENLAANHSTPPRDLQMPPWPDFWAPPANATFVPRVDGQFTGSTNEIITWGACKWGIDANVVRAMAVSETFWRQSFEGDEETDPAKCVAGDTPPCPTSFGLLQLKHTTRPGSWPYSKEHTAFNVDYSLGVLRGCYEGYVTYLLDDGYAAGDLWGCVGWHYSGEWMDEDAVEYIEGAQEHYVEREWLEW